MISNIITYFILVVIPHRTISRVFHDPTGEYTAIVSYSTTIVSLFPAMPGQSGDKPGFIKILNTRGKNFGEIPVSMIQNVFENRDIKWTNTGAYMTSEHGEWNFKNKTCFYWNESQEYQIPCSQ